MNINIYLNTTTLEVEEEKNFLFSKLRSSVLKPYHSRPYL